MMQAATTMPRYVKPMLAEAHDAPPRGEDWAFEFKWDGVRAVIRWDGRTLSLHSRLGNDITARYPELHGLGDLLGRRPAMLDGEIVAFDEHGRPSFQRIQNRIHLTGSRRIAVAARRVPVACLVFDVLWLDDEPWLERAYTARRDALAALALNHGPWRTPEYAIGDGETLLRIAARAGLEGVVAKRIDSPYLPDRRSGLWRKIRTRRRQEFVIGGWTPGKGRRAGGVGAILVGYHDAQGQLRYAGKVGAGLSDRDLQELARLFHARQRDDSPFIDGAIDRHARFVHPELVAEVAFTEWTGDGVLRHSSFQGLRNDKNPRHVVRET